MSEHYSQDVDTEVLPAHLKSLRSLFKKSHPGGPGEKKKAVSLKDISHKLSSLGDAQKLFSSVKQVMKLLLVVPASSAVAERSFSALRRLKAYLRSTMTQERLQHLALLHVHKDRLNRLDLRSVTRDFVRSCPSRKAVCGVFIEFIDMSLDVIRLHYIRYILWIS